MYLVIDIGNTRHKIAVFNQSGRLMTVQYTPKVTVPFIAQFLSNYSIQAALISSVGYYSPLIRRYLSKMMPVYEFSKALKLPISIAYSTTETLGTDRIANAVGANALYPNHNVLSIQAGSCLVLDFINADNIYIGGSISPGLEMRFKALPYFTAQLPLVNKHPIDYILGDSTEKSILSGILNGYRYEIEGWIAEYKCRYSSLKVIITGGDAELINCSKKNRIFAAPNLVLFGLYKILKLNVSES